MDRIASWLLVMKEGMSEGKIDGKNAAKRRTKLATKKNLYCTQTCQFSRREMSLLFCSTNHIECDSLLVKMIMGFAMR